MNGGGVQDRARRGSVWPWVAAALAVSCGVWTLAAGESEPDAGGTPRKQGAQIRALSEALAAARAENDFLRARLDRRECEPGGGAIGDWVPGGRDAGEAEFRIVDVNRGLGMVVLNAGRRQGVRPGMTFAVMQGDRSVAQLRVVDARGAVAGAVIETAAVRRYPKAQDRVIRTAGIRE